MWASGVNSYYAESEWTVAAEYAVAATDRLTITPGVQYFGNVAFSDTGAALAVGGASNTATTYYLTNDWSDNDAWKAGVTVDYAITEGLTSKVTVNYLDVEDADETWTGFVRLERSF